MPFTEYFAHVWGDTTAVLSGSAGSGVEGTLDDLLALARELREPTRIAPETLEEACTVQFPGLVGVLPGFGRQEPNDWGLGFELRDAKSPHWTGARNSPRTFGHFGRSRHVPVGRPGRERRARLPHRPRVRRLGGRGVAAPVRRGPGGNRLVQGLSLGVSGSALLRDCPWACLDRPCRGTVPGRVSIGLVQGLSLGVS